MPLLELPAEIRLRIYAELLVSRDGNLVFDLDHGYPLADYPLVDYQNGFVRYASSAAGYYRGSNGRPVLFARYGLWPPLLRTSRAVHCEAQPLLYTQNRFYFLEGFRFACAPATNRWARGGSFGGADYHDDGGDDGDDSDDNEPSIAVFLRQIGPANAALLRHVSLRLLTWSPYGKRLPRVYPADERRFFRVLRTACTGLQTLALACQLAGCIVPVGGGWSSIVQIQGQGIIVPRADWKGWEKEDEEEEEEEQEEEEHGGGPVNMAAAVLRSLEDAGGLGAMPALRDVVATCEVPRVDDALRAFRARLLRRMQSDQSNSSSSSSRHRRPRWGFEFVELPELGEPRYGGGERHGPLIINPGDVRYQGFRIRDYGKDVETYLVSY